MSNDSTLLGAAGEYYVMAELLRRGFIAALAPQGVPNSDIVVANLTGDKNAMTAMFAGCRRTMRTPISEKKIHTLSVGSNPTEMHGTFLA